MLKAQVLKVPVLFFLSTLLTGCHPAVLVVPSYIQSVGVSTFENRTSYYGFDTILTSRTIHQFQVDGRLPLEDPERADLVVKAVLQQYLEQPIFFDPKTNNVLQYEISVVYDLTAFDRRENKTFIEDKDKRRSIYYYTAQYTGAIQQSKDDAVSQLAEEVGRSIVRRVLQGY
jgi:hypothetical protein